MRVMTIDALYGLGVRRRANLGALGALTQDQLASQVNAFFEQVISPLQDAVDAASSLTRESQGAIVSASSLAAAQALLDEMYNFIKPFGALSNTQGLTDAEAASFTSKVEAYKTRAASMTASVSATVSKAESTASKRPLYTALIGFGTAVVLGGLVFYLARKKKS